MKFHQEHLEICDFLLLNADMIDKVIVSAVRSLYPQGNIVWKDDPVNIYRSQVALDAIQRKLVSPSLGNHQARIEGEHF